MILSAAEHVLAPLLPAAGAEKLRGPGNSPRLLLLLPAGTTLRDAAQLLARVPPAVLDATRCAAFVVAEWNGADLAAVDEGGGGSLVMPLTVSPPGPYRGPGGAQKLGFAFAMRERFDLVAPIGGRATPPENLPRLLAPVLDGAADVCLGRRPRRGPRSWLAARLLGTPLDDPMTTATAMTVDVLRRLRFLASADDVSFATELIVQLIAADARIVEVPIHLGPGGAPPRALARALRWMAHRMGVLYQRRYDPDPDGIGHYTLKLGYASSHTMALAAVPSGSRVLDIGSGPAALAGELARRGCAVTIVDRVRPTDVPPAVQVVVQDLDEPLRFDPRPFDHLLLLDIVEHLSHPERFLRDLRGLLAETRCTLVLTTPNVAFAVQRLMLLAGQFNYGKAGILDRTHRRLFTFRGISRLLRDEGFLILETRGIPAPFPKVLGDGCLGRLAVAANTALIGVSKTLFAYQVFIRATTMPSLEEVLDDARTM